MIIPVKTSVGSYEIIIENGILSNVSKHLKLERKVLIVTDSGVPEIYSKTIAAQCQSSYIVTFEQGEKSKNIKTFEYVLSKLVEFGFTRSDCVVAVGGGVVGDISGFVASCYMRGIDFYNIPTTVLSQVDSSVGGKTAIDFMGLKNIVGAFYPPKAVIIDPETLKTLPKRQISNGLAEALKMSITNDKALFELFENKDVEKNLEEIIEAIRINHGVENRVCGIVIDTETGAILAMATSSPFDPNKPMQLSATYQEKLDASGFLPGTTEYDTYKNDLRQLMWSNKAVTETYEPGSTFKIITVSAALDMGTSSVNDCFSCNGYREVGGYRIRCHKVGGHGSGFSLAYGLQMSCNPCMIAISEKLGADNFYSYVERFGYFEKSGIDLPGEGTTIFHSKENIGATELATASFGQRFKVSIINQLVAISAIANDGKLVRPYIVDKVIDSNGKVISQHQTEVREQVVSVEVANTVSQILIDGVNGDGGAKNAGVIGYDIAAKTGTSQKFDILDENGNSYLRIGSTVGFAIDEDQGVSMIIVVDEPTSQVKYGSVVAAPYVSMLYERILPYLEFNSKPNQVNTNIDNYVGLTVEDASKKAQTSKLSYEIIGDGDKIISQVPAAGDVLTYPLSKILLYTEKSEKEMVIVPELKGMNLAEAIRALVDNGFNIRISGNGAITPSANDKVFGQSIAGGALVQRGEIITIRVVKEDYED